jgi:hypothetical protein
MWQKAKATVALGLVISIGAIASSAIAEQGCGSFQRYAASRDFGIDSNAWLSASEKELAKIDKWITREELANSFECVRKLEVSAIDQLFQDVPYVIDADLYQFAFSDFSYGRVLVSRDQYSHYLRERIKEGMKILKLTFDFDEQARVVTKDIFAARVVSGKVEYSEFVNGRYEVTDRCFACHKSNKTGGLFFKRRFTGHKFTDK